MAIEVSRYEQDGVQYICAGTAETPVGAARQAAAAAIFAGEFLSDDMERVDGCCTWTVTKLRLEYLHETPTLLDGAGGRWWPSREAEEKINAASDRDAGGSWDASEAEAIAQERAGNGEWRT